MTAARGSRSDPKRVSERDFSRQVIELLVTLRWKPMHVFPLQTAHGWRTPTTSPGYPDVTAIRGPYILGIELKGYSVRGDKGTPVTAAQLEWLEAFSGLDGGRGWLLRPTDPEFEALVGWLRHPADAPKRYGW